MTLAWWLFWIHNRTLQLSHVKPCRKSEVGSRKSEVGSRKSEVGSRKSLLGFRTPRLSLHPSITVGFVYIWLVFHGTEQSVTKRHTNRTKQVETKTANASYYVKLDVLVNDVNKTKYFYKANLAQTWIQQFSAFMEWPYLSLCTILVAETWIILPEQLTQWIFLCTWWTE